MGKLKQKKVRQRRMASVCVCGVCVCVFVNGGSTTACAGTAGVRSSFSEAIVTLNRKCSCKR